MRQISPERAHAATAASVPPWFESHQKRGREKGSVSIAALPRPQGAAVRFRLDNAPNPWRTNRSAEEFSALATQGGVILAVARHHLPWANRCRTFSAKAQHQNVQGVRTEGDGNTVAPSVQKRNIKTGASSFYVLAFA